VKRILRGTVENVPADAVLPPKSLRVRIRQLEYGDDVSFVEGMPVSEPQQVRVLYDASTPIADAPRLSNAFKQIAKQIDDAIASYQANGGRM
jgi:hypothetical protein